MKNQCTDSKLTACYCLPVYSSALTDKATCNLHFWSPIWNCMTHCQALKGFPNTSQVSVDKNKKISLRFYSCSCREPEVTAALNFISEHTALSNVSRDVSHTTVMSPVCTSLYTFQNINTSFISHSCYLFSIFFIFEKSLSFPSDFQLKDLKSIQREASKKQSATKWSIFQDWDKTSDCSKKGN
jgi:hypothetical protein